MTATSAGCIFPRTEATQLASKKNTAEGYELLVRELRKNPKAEYAVLRDKAETKGFTVYPVMFGRAKASLGLVKTAPRGSKKKAAKRGPGRPKGSKNKVKRGPGRPRTSSSALDIGDLVAMMKELQRERDEAVAKLDRIRKLLG